MLSVLHFVETYLEWCHQQHVAGKHLSQICNPSLQAFILSVSVLQTSAQQALTGTINSSMQAVHAAQATLDDFETLPPLGQDAVSAG